jgi:hypothetical protein
LVRRFVDGLLSLREDQLAVAGEAKPVFGSVMQKHRFPAAFQKIAKGNLLDRLWSGGFALHAVLTSQELQNIPSIYLQVTCNFIRIEDFGIVKSMA